MDFMPDTFSFQVMSTVLVCSDINRDVHDAGDKHGSFDREDRKILERVSSYVIILSEASERTSSSTSL